MRVRLAIAIGLVLVAAAVAVELSDSQQRLAGSNTQVAVSGNDVGIGAREQGCQEEGIPEKTAALRIYVGPRGRMVGPIDVAIRHRGRTLASGSFGKIRGGLVATAPISPKIDREVTPVQVCFRNRGPSEVRLAGDRTPIRGGGSNPYGALYDDEPRIDYLRAGEESWWDVAGVVAERFGQSKTSFFGSWTMWGVFALVGVIWLATIALLLRRLPAR